MRMTGEKRNSQDEKMILLLTRVQMILYMLCVLCLMGYAAGAGGSAAQGEFIHTVDPYRAVVATAITVIAGLGIFAVRNLGK